MHKEGLCAKKWTKIDPNQGSKAILFPRTQRTLLINPEKTQSCPTTTNPQK
jgi:hypothetical protein